jgi:hypothetical protein
VADEYGGVGVYIPDDHTVRTLRSARGVRPEGTGIPNRMCDTEWSRSAVAHNVGAN